jgi:hypothetical protein
VKMPRAYRVDFRLELSLVVKENRSDPEGHV